MTATSATERALAAKRALFDKHYGFLTEKQRRAVFTVENPLLILAGAGSGKTTVLIHRIAFILRYGNAYFSPSLPPVDPDALAASAEGLLALPADQLETALLPFADRPCPPWAILAITFTNKAANEIKSRLASTVGEENASQVWAGTFHSVCMRILRKYGDRVGLCPGFTIYDTDDTKKLLSRCMTDLQIDEKTMPPRSVQNAISRAKDEVIGWEDYKAQAGSDFRRGQIARIYEQYQKRLRESNAVDFDDIILLTVRLLEEDEEARDYYQHRFRYVMVDEYQDTNGAQFRLVRLLSGHYNNLMVVGDDDQSIYKFRGATIENILQFDRVLENAAVIKLEQNFRSTKTILDAANAVIRNNVGRRGKELWTAGEAGERITYRRLDNQNEEGRYLVGRIEELVRTEGRKYSDFAVLYRINAQSNGLESAFNRSGIPYRIVGGTRFNERKEIKDVMAYVSLINNPADNLRLRRIINEPKRKIGASTVEAVDQIAASEGVSMFEVMSRADHYPALVKSAERLKGFVDMIQELRVLSRSGRVSELIDRTLDRTGYRMMLIAAGQAELDRLENVQELISNAKEYEMNHEDEEGGYSGSLEGFLEETALVSDLDSYDEKGDAVVLMTIHSAKGLEFPVVFLPGLEEGIFPGIQSATDPSELEEERRLAYVALTRAKKRLILTTARERMLFGRTGYNPPSRFLSEIPEELLEREEPRRVLSSEAEDVSSRRFPSAAAQMARRAAAAPSAKPQAPTIAFAPGDRVVHATFGPGTLLSATRMGSDLLYEVAFDRVGTKKLMATYAKLKKE